MAGASRHASPLRATEELVRANFSDEAYVNLAGADCERIELLVALQKQFKTIVVFARRQHGELKAALAKWRERVQCGEVEFDQLREEWFKGELARSISLWTPWTRRSTGSTSGGRLPHQATAAR